MTERQLSDAVSEAAKLLGWHAYHTHDSRRSAAGFPDWTFARDRVIFAELKTEKGVLSVDQDLWLDALDRAGAEVHIWRPADWHDGTIEKHLRRRTA